MRQLNRLIAEPSKSPESKVRMPTLLCTLHPASQRPHALLPVAHTIAMSPVAVKRAIRRRATRF
jgi:hypothetical protein